MAEGLYAVPVACGLKGNKPVICHYSYNLLLGKIFLATVTLLWY